MRSMHRAVVAVLLVFGAGWTQSGKFPTPAEQPNTYRGEASKPTGVAKAPAKAKGCIRLAAFNVENLFDAVDDPKLGEPNDDLPMATDATRLQNIAAAIRELDADVIGLEEVESEACLRWFRDTYLKDMGYEHMVSLDVGYARGVEQSVLSRFPIESTTLYRDATLAAAKARMPDDPAIRKREGWAADGDLTRGFQRSPLHAVVRLPDGSALHLFVVHLKSGPKKQFAHQREMESLAIANLLDAVRKKDQDAQIAVVGDFNCQPSDKAAKLLRDPKFGNLVSAYECRPGAKGGGKFRDEGDQAASGAEARKYLTHSFVLPDQDGRPIERAIDFILLSRGLFERANRGSYFVLGLPKSLHPGPDKPAGYASDHNPIAVDLKVQAADGAARGDAERAGARGGKGS